MNFLEQLVNEWFEYQGSFVLTNQKFGRLGHGGWQGEMDIAAFDPLTGSLTHVEVSIDADTWAKRRTRIGQKFDSAEPFYSELFPFAAPPIRQLAIIGTSPKPKTRLGLPKVEEMSIPEFVHQVTAGLADAHPLRAAVPEHLPSLRAMQFALHWG